MVWVINGPGQMRGDDVGRAGRYTLMIIGRGRPDLIGVPSLPRKSSYYLLAPSGALYIDVTANKYFHMWPLLKTLPESIPRNL